jgi:ribosomal protein S6--L-glutamate ligase
MRLIMLARNASLYSHKRLVEAAHARGHTIDVVNTLQLHMNITSNNPVLRLGDTTLPHYDAVIPRIGASVTFYGLAVLRQFEMRGMWSLNESVAIGRARDKLRCLQILARDGVGLPITAFAHDPSRSEAVINEVGGAPCVIKLLEGTQGVGVILADTVNSAKSIIEAFRKANVNILVQEYIREANGADLRVLVVGDQAVAAMQRRGRPGEFRSNLHRGGKAEPAAISDEEREQAVKAARSLGLNVCGVDMLRSKKGPLVMEVNPTPGLEGIERAAGIDVADRILAFIEHNAQPGATGTKGRG